MKTLTKLSLITVCLTVCLCRVWAGTATLGWNPYTGTADTIRLYAVPGTNTAFSGANVTNWVTVSTPSTNTSCTMSNLSPGAWTFTADAYSSASGLASPTVPTVWTNVPAVIVSTNPVPPAALSGFGIRKVSP